MLEDRPLRLVQGSGPDTPEGVPGPLRLLALLEELCGPRVFWIGTKVELAAQLQVNEKTGRQWVSVVESAGVAAWVKQGGGKPGALYLLRRGDGAIAAVREAIEHGIWADASPGQHNPSPGLSPGLSPGQHNADTNPSPGQPIDHPVNHPVDPPYTVSSSSSSSSSGHPVEELPTGNEDPGWTLAARVYAIGVEPTPELLRELMLAGPDIADLALRESWKHNAKTPLYVQRTLRSIRNTLHVSRIVPAAESFFGPRPVEAEDEESAEDVQPPAPAPTPPAAPAGVPVPPAYPTPEPARRTDAELEASYVQRFRRPR